MMPTYAISNKMTGRTAAPKEELAPSVALSGGWKPDEPVDPARLPRLTPYE